MPIELGLPLLPACVPLKNRDGGPEVDALGMNGPSGGSIVAMGIRDVLGVVSTLILPDLIRPNLTVEAVRA